MFADLYLKPVHCRHSSRNRCHKTDADSAMNLNKVSSLYHLTDYASKNGWPHELDKILVLNKVQNANACIFILRYSFPNNQSYPNSILYSSRIMYLCMIAMNANAD